MAQTFDFVVFSHLRWDFVFQRPQHLLSRFAAGHRVIFIEEPMPATGENSWEIRETDQNVTVCRALTTEQSSGFSDAQLTAMNRMMPDLMRQLDLKNYVVWFYTPMALPLIEHFTPQAIVYDCMDELSAFLGAPKELIEREEKLLKLSDLVFTGGPSLYRAKQHRHPNVHCFSSSVDSKHYAKARPGSQIEAKDQKSLPQPKFGYFGVIDERIDLGLLDHMARTHPDWQICMVGPVVKIDPATLPNHPNIRYFGQRQYAELPSYLAGWDVCMLPFARNNSTKFISPTKTLEYMAAERMIVSTPITDVAEPYGHVVYLGSTEDEFVDACGKALTASKPERKRRVRMMQDVLSKTSWDSTANRMLQLIRGAIEKTNNMTEGVFLPPAAKPATTATVASGSNGAPARVGPGSEKPAAKPAVLWAGTRSQAQGD